jgi:hypothetical protein
MAGIPDGIVLTRDRDLAGRSHELWVRRGLFALLPLIAVLALLNVFGQDETTSTEDSSTATLDLRAPERVRGGLLYQARFTIRAHADVKNARLELGPGWLEHMTINTIEPAPLNEASSNGLLSLEFGHVPAGQTFVLYVDFQVNPTNVGRRAAPVTLFDGEEELLTIDRTITVFP